MTSAVLIYSGPNPESVRLVASSSDPVFVARVAHLLSQEPLTSDPVLREVEAGRQRALKVLSERSGRPRLAVVH